MRWHETMQYFARHGVGFTRSAVLLAYQKLLWVEAVTFGVDV